MEFSDGQFFPVVMPLVAFDNDVRRPFLPTTRLLDRSRPFALPATRNRNGDALVIAPPRVYDACLGEAYRHRCGAWSSKPVAGSDVRGRFDSYTSPPLLSFFRPVATPATGRLHFSPPMAHPCAGVVLHEQRRRFQSSWTGSETIGMEGEEYRVICPINEGIIMTIITVAAHVCLCPHPRHQHKNYFASVCWAGRSVCLFRYFSS